MSRTVIKSLADPNSRRYVVSTERVRDDWRSSNQYMSDHVGWYETYGDGECQHCGMGSVNVEMFTDFCASVAQYLSEDHLDCDDVARVMASEMRSYNINASEVRGAMSVVYKDGKRRYVNRSDWKVSSSESKQHDKRWEEIVVWMDGSFKAVAGLLRIGNGNFLRAWNECYMLRSVWYDVTGHSGPDCESILEWVPWAKDYSKANQAQNAFAALKQYCKAQEAKEQAKRCLDCFLANDAQQRENAAAEAAAKVA